jgi:hypothetical protein
MLESSSDIEEEFIKTVDDDVLENTSIEDENPDMLDEVPVGLPKKLQVVNNARARPMSSAAPRLSLGSTKGKVSSGSAMIEEAVAAAVNSSIQTLKTGL